MYLRRTSKDLNSPFLLPSIETKSPQNQNILPKNPSKKILPKIFPKNSSKKISPKKFLQINSSKKIPKNPKNFQSIQFPLGGRKPFWACFFSNFIYLLFKEVQFFGLRSNYGKNANVFLTKKRHFAILKNK